jgi:SRSO17 transposase
VVAHLAGVADPLGTVVVVDETRAVKKGTPTPSVRRPYLGCVGRVENAIVAVHLSVARGPYRSRIDADLFVPVG